MVLSGILISIRLPSIKRNDHTLWYYQVFSFQFDYLQQRETIIHYGIIRYSHFDSITFNKEKRWYVMVLSGVLISIRLPSTKRNDNTLWYYQVFSFRFDYLQQRETMIRYGIIRYSHLYSITFDDRQQETNIYYVIFRYSRIRGLKIPLSYATWLIEY